MNCRRPATTWRREARSCWQDQFISCIPMLLGGFVFEHIFQSYLFGTGDDDDDDSEKVIVIWRRQWFSSQNAHGKKPWFQTVGHFENCISLWPKNWKSFDTLSLVAKNNITTKVLRCKPRNPQAILAKTTCLVSSYIFTMFPMLFMGSFWFSALVGCMGQNYQLSPPKMDGFSSGADPVGSSKLMENSVSIPKYKGFL